MLFSGRPRAWLAAGALLAALSVAPAAQASGGVNSGGVNSGGSKPASSTCAPISSYSVTTGYYKQWAATWASFSVPACEALSTVSWDIQYHNDDTGQIDFERSLSVVVPSAGYSYTLDDDFGPFNTTYTVTLTLSDASGAQTTRSATITTKPPKQPGTV
jgi:hypothetical protein